MNAPQLLMSENISDLISAYVAAQAKIDNVNQDREVEVPIKDKANPGSYKGKYKYRYATLPGILNHIRDALTKNGIWYTQFVRGGFMITRLLHNSGQWMDTGDVPLPDIRGNPQDVGGIISYFKRYSLIAAMGLASEDDNDGDSDAEINFQAHGARRGGKGKVIDEEPKVDAPAMGWGDWARGLIAIVDAKETDAELDEVRDSNKRYINAVSKIDRAMYGDIQKAFTNRRAIVNDSLPF